MSATASPAATAVPEKKPVKFSNLLLGAGLNLFEVTTLGQPLEVTKTTMSANRGESMAGALRIIWNRGGVFGCKSTIALTRHTLTPLLPWGSLSLLDFIRDPDKKAREENL